jgi:two-component system CheB/CheR fusion protein
MNNLLSGSGIATVFVDHKLRIMRFTPTATRIINLILSDVGRPVAHIVSNLVGYDRLVEDVQAVLDSLIPKEVEVQTKEGKWYSMRMMPYRTTLNMIEGAVITFVDITEIKRALLEMRNSEERYRNMLEWSPNAIVVHRDGKIIYANTAALEMFGATSLKDLLGNPILERIHPDYHQTVLARVQKALHEGVSVPMIELKYIKLDGTIIDGEAQATSILYDGLPSIQAAIRDITVHKQTEEALRKANERLRLSGVVNDAK